MQWKSSASFLFLSLIYSFNLKLYSKIESCTNIREMMLTQLNSMTEGSWVHITSSALCCDTTQSPAYFFYPHFVNLIVECRWKYFSCSQPEPTLENVEANWGRFLRTPEFQSTCIKNHCRTVRLFLLFILKDYVDVVLKTSVRLPL